MAVAAVIQMNSRPDVERNLETVRRLVQQAVGAGAALVVLPEGFAYMGPEAERAALAEDLKTGGPILECCTSLAREQRCEIIAGGFPERTSGDKISNSCLHVDADGNLTAVYRKIHLFDVSLPDGTQHAESRTVEAGAALVVAETAVGKAGLSICYDVRFPELYGGLVDMGATVLAVPSAFTQTTGKDHWHILLRARAIETQCYVLAAAQVGAHYADRVSFGHALIVDPWGRVLEECGDGEGFVAAEIDSEYTGRVREQIPCLRNRKRA